MAVIDDYPAKLTTGYYRVRESWEDTASQVGAFRILANAIAKCDDNPGTYVFDNDGNAIYPEEETEEETGVEEVSGVEDDTETGDDTEVEEDTESGEEDTADGDTADDDTDDVGTEDDGTVDDGVAAVSEDTDEEGTADSDVEDSDAVDTDTEDDSSDDGDTEGTNEEETTDDETGDESADEADEDTDDTDEEFPEAEQDPVAYARLKTLMNIRTEPSLEAEILTTYTKGTIVSVLEILDTGWLKIICDAADEGYAYVSNVEGEYAYVGTSLYTVKSGDTLWKIAEEQLGSGTLYKEIRTLNGLTSNTIKVGMQLILP